ncbi:MAG: type II secretion system minor pseudopilin GspK [Gallionellaceae bacterium]|jgi:general secretion pathway protein K
MKNTSQCKNLNPDKEVPMGCRQQGVAIIMVLLIVAMATSLAAYMALQQNLWQRQVESQFARAQARQLGAAGMDWGRAVLAEDARGSSVDHEKEIWTLRLPAIPVEGGEVIGSIEDRQGLFNLNNVVTNVAQFQRLLGVLGLPADLAPALADWMDADSEPQPGGAEDGYYLGLPQPYRTSNRALVEIGELAGVRGYDSRTIDVLRAFVSVLPANRTPVNVNFAPAEVMMAVIEGLTLSDARLLVQQRQGQPFKDIADFKRRLPHGGVKIVDNEISVKSDYFWVTGRASVEQAQVVTQALMHRASNWPTVVWQSVQ